MLAYAFTYVLEFIVDRLGDFDNIQLLLEEHGSHMGAAEVHGLAAGMLCVQFDAEFDRWLVAVFEEPEQVEKLSTVSKQDLFAVFAGTAELLKGEEFLFDLFLPHEDEYVRIRAHALSEWCQGFLYGFAYMGITEDAAWGEESKGVLKDLFEIARIDSDGSEDADEEAFVELQEYVRVAVQIVRDELHPVEDDDEDDDSDDEPTLH